MGCPKRRSRRERVEFPRCCVGCVRFGWGRDRWRSDCARGARLGSTRLGVGEPERPRVGQSEPTASSWDLLPTNMTQLSPSVRMLARHPRIGTPCSLLGSSTALALASARPRAQPSTCRPQLRTFSAHSPTQKPLAGAAPIAVELNERTVTVQLHGGHTTSLSVHAPLLPVLPPPPLRRSEPS